MKSRGVYRLMWFFIGIIFLQGRIVVISSPTEINVHRLLIYTLLICELFPLKNFTNDFKTFPLKQSMAIVLIGLALIAFFDLRHNPFLNLYRVTDDFIQTFFVVFLCYINIREEEDLKKILKFFLISALIVSIYGLYNFITKSNPYDTLISNSFPSSESYFANYALGDGRFRVNSFASHPIYYGYLSGVLFLLTVYSFYFIKEHKTLCLLLMPLTFLNLLFSNSRTPLLAAFVGLIVFILIAFRKRQKIKVFFIACLLAFICYPIPLVKNRVDDTLDIFVTGGEKTIGSSIDLRTTQLIASYQEFLKKPIFGNGFKYITEDLGATDDAETNKSDTDFGGFESYGYHLLIEQGAVGILINLIFFTSLIIFFLKHTTTENELNGLGAAITLMFLTYSIGTGVLGSWPISMGLIGIILKLLELKAAGSVNGSNESERVEMDYDFNIQYSG